MVAVSLGLVKEKHLGLENKKYLAKFGERSWFWFR